MNAAPRPAGEPVDLPLPRDQTWLHTLGPFGCFDRLWTMRTTEAAVADFLEAAYAPMRVSRPDPQSVSVERLSLIVPEGGRPGAVYRGNELIRRSEDPSLLLGDLVWGTIRVVIAASSDRLMLHTAAVAGCGSAIALVGPTSVGKSTLTAELLGRGLGYLTDEAAVIDTDLVIRGFPKPLTIDRGAWGLLHHLDPRGDERLAAYFERQWQLLPSSLGPVVQDSRLQLVVFPRFEPHSSVSCRRLSPGACLAEAAKSVFSPNGQVAPAARVRDLADVLASVPCYLLEYGSLAGAVAALDDLMSSI